MGELFDGNYRPGLEPIEPQVAFEGTVATIDLLATDANEADIVTFGTEGLPSFASLVDNGDGTAVINIDGQTGDANIYMFSVNVSDGEKGRTKAITLILKDPDVEIQIPVLDQVSDFQVPQSALIKLEVLATDLDRLTVDISSVELPDFATLVDNGDKTASLTFNPDFSVVAQPYTVTLKVEDSNGASSMMAFMVEVLETEKFNDYYCDPLNGSMNNIGSAEMPWSSLQDVFEAGKKFEEGNTIYLRSGYHGEAVINDANNGLVAIKPEGDADW